MPAIQYVQSAVTYLRAQTGIMNVLISLKPTIAWHESSVYKACFSLPGHCSGLPSERINLSPFTKDFRGGGHLMSLR